MVLFNNNIDNRVFNIYLNMVKTISLKKLDKDEIVPRFSDFILSPLEYSIIRANKELYMESMADVKMLYLLFVSNIQGIYESYMASFMLSKDGSHHEHNRVIYIKILRLTNIFMRSYFLFVLPMLELDFPMYLVKFETRDMRYIILNLLHGGKFVLTEIIDLKLFPLWNFDIVTDSYSSLINNPFYGNIRFIELLNNTDLLLSKKPSSSNLILLKLSIKDLELEGLKDESLLKLYKLSKVYVDNFSSEYEKLNKYNEKFISIQKLMFVYMLLNILYEYNLWVNIFEEIIMFLLNLFNLTCSYLKGYYNKDLIENMVEGERSIKVLLPMYEESELFMNIYTKYIMKCDEIKGIFESK